uniref:Uncharacterized protein n=1 Tax=Tanacetum cinerariifolium TaxID=118510 RepID=A0A699GEK7_TANCI|nr:hypothetical protein [Tanacetum cinerariifolium]
MGGHEHGDAARSSGQQQFLHVARGARIEAVDRFIENQHGRLVNQRAGQAQALLHAQRVVHGVVFARIVQTEFGQQARAARDCLGARKAVHFGDELQDLASAQVVVEHRGVGQVAYPAFHFRRLGMTIETVDHHPSGAGHEDAHHHADGGGLAGAVGAEEAEQLPARHGQIERLDGVEAAIGFGQSLEIDHDGLPSVGGCLYQRAAHAVAPAFADGRHRAVRVEHQRVGSADFLRLRAPALAALRQRLRFGARAVTGFDVGGVAIALGQARRVDGLRHGHAQVDVIENRLQHGGDDGGAARAADRERGFAVPERQRGRHAAARALARFRHIGRGPGKIEVGHLVIEQEAVARHHHAAAAPRFNGIGVRDDIAFLVGDRQVRGVRVFGQQPGAGRALRHALVVLIRIRVARHCMAGGAGRIDQRAAAGGVILVQQAGDGGVDEFRVGQVGVAVGERQPARFQVQVLGLVARHGFQVVALQDVERFGHGHAAGTGQRHAIQVVAAIGAVHGQAQARLVIGQVGHGHVTGADRDAGGYRGAVDGVDHGAAHGARIKSLDAAGGQFAVRARQVRVAQHAARCRRLAMFQIERGGGREFAELVAVDVHQVREIGVDGEAVGGHRDGGRKDLPERHRAVAVQRLVPAAHRAGHAHRHAAGYHGVEIDRLAMVEKDERRKAGGRRFAVVDGDHALVLGQVDHHEAAAADAAAERIGHAQRGCRRHGRIDGVAAPVQDGDGGPGRRLADGGHRAAGAGGHWRLGQRRLPGKREDDGGNQDRAVAGMHGRRLSDRVMVLAYPIRRPISNRQVEITTGVVRWWPAGEGQAIAGDAARAVGHAVGQNKIAAAAIGPDHGKTVADVAGPDAHGAFAAAAVVDAVEPHDAAGGRGNHGAAALGQHIGGGKALRRGGGTAAARRRSTGVQHGHHGGEQGQDDQLPQYGCLHSDLSGILE